MSGTEDFGTGGYGADDAERAAAEAGPGGSTRNVPPTGPRVHVPGVPNQGAAASPANGGTNGTPWLAAGSVPYAEAMFGGGGAGQDGPQGPGGPRGMERGVGGRVPRGVGAGAGRRGVPETAGQVQTAGPGYPDGYPPEYGQGPDGYANGYAPHPGQPQTPPMPQVPQLPQQRYDAAPFDSGFTEQARFAAQAQARQPQPQQPPQPSQVPQMSQMPQGGYERQPQDLPGSGFESGTRFEQAPYQGRPYPGAVPGQGQGQAQRPGFDEPTTEFMPGPLFDEPTMRPAPPPPGQAAAGNAVNGRGSGSVFSPRQSPQGPQAPQGVPGSQGPVNGTAPSQPPGTTPRPSMSGSGTWTAGPPPTAQQAPQPQVPQPQAPQLQKPPQAAGVTVGQPPAPGQPSGGPLGASQSSMSVSGIPRVPSQQAAGAVVSQPSQSLPSAPSVTPVQPVQPTQSAAPPPSGSTPFASASSAPVGAVRGDVPQRADGGYSNAPMPSRPPLPDEPPPGPPPLPVRPPRAERQAQQAQALAQAQAQAHVQAQAQGQAQFAAQAAMASPAAAAVRETLTPPRRLPQPPPAEQSPAASAPPQQSPDDLTSERLRSVAPSVPAPRVSTPEPQAARTTAASAAPAAAPSVAPAQSAPAQSVQAPPAPQKHDADEGEELVVPWQGGAAAAPAVAEAPEDDDGDDDVLHGSGSHHPAPQPQTPQPQPQQPVRQDQAPAAPAQQQQPQPQPQAQAQQTPVAEQAPVPTQSPQTSAPTRPEATAVPSAAPVSGTPSPVGAPFPTSNPSPSTAQPQSPDQAPAAAPAEAGAGPENAAPAPPVVPAPRGTRRRVPETAAEADAQQLGAQPQVQDPFEDEDQDQDFDPGDLPTAPQPHLRPAPAAATPSSPMTASSPTTAPTARSTSAPTSPPAPPTAPSKPTLSTRPAPSMPTPTASPVPPAAPPAPTQQPRQAAPLEESADPTSRASGYDEDALAAVYRVIHERRDVRNDFLADPVPTEVLTRILEAAHTAPSVGFSQPWDFLVIRDQPMRQRVHELAVRQRRSYAASLPKARARAFAALKIEAILDTPINIVVTCDPTRGGRHTLGRYTQPLMAPFSSCLAVENLWLAARAEGLGVGWVSFFDERELAAVLDLPDHLQVVAYLCVGYVKSFPPEPELAGAGWAQRRPLAWAVHEERFGHRALPGAEPISLLSETVAAIRGLDPEALGAARDRQARMTKPPGSLGALEALSEQLSGLAGVCPPPMPEPAALAVFAGDHGVHAQGVTPWPQEVTAQMVANFLAGGAVVNAFAKQVGAEVCVVDVGVAADLAAAGGLIPRKIRYGTADMTQGPALTREEATAAIEAGIETARDLVAAGNRCLLTGDMGIANTTASAALIAAFTGASPAQVTGYGTGIDEQTYAHKVEVVRTALELHRPDPQDPVGVLAAFGGLEHAALAGFILGASALRVPVVLDGVIAGAAALVAQALSPEVTAACVAGHRSAEPGHALALEQLGITPLIDLELRLGEGSGAALALPLVGAAVRALREVATFDSAGVSDASSEAVAPPTPAERERT